LSVTLTSSVTGPVSSWLMFQGRVITPFSSGCGTSSSGCGCPLARKSTLSSARGRPSAQV
jgi:hypothetical protein